MKRRLIYTLMDTTSNVILQRTIEKKKEYGILELIKKGWISLPIYVPLFFIGLKRWGKDVIIQKIIYIKSIWKFSSKTKMY